MRSHPLGGVFRLQYLVTVVSTWGMVVCLGAQESLVPNGGFEEREVDGWVKGWERLQLTADCTVEPLADDTGNTAIHIIGKSRLSKGGVRAPLIEWEGYPSLRITLRYQGVGGRRMVIIRPAGSEPGEIKKGKVMPLRPSPIWRLESGTLDLESGDATWLDEAVNLEVALLHEGPGQTWFDDLQVLSGEPTPMPGLPAPPTAPSTGPYITAPYPEEGDTVQVNPPRFRWPGRPGGTYTLEISQAADFPANSTTRVEGLKLNIYIPSQPLTPGQWYWRVTTVSGALPSPTLDLSEEEPSEGSDRPGIPSVETENPPRVGANSPPPNDGSPAEEALPAGQEDSDTVAVPPAGEAEVAGEELSIRTIPGMPGLGETSAVRGFRIAESAAVVPVPSVEAVLMALPSHPRVWVTMESVLTLRGLIAGLLKPQWNQLLSRLDTAKGATLPEEPKGKGKWRNPSRSQLKANEALFQVAAGEAWWVRDFALAALLSGEQSYAEEAKRRALHLAEWDVKGSTGYESHDQAFREILLALALVLDWIPDRFAPEERAKIIEAVSARGNELYKVLSTGPRPLNLFPFSSHGQTAVGFLTIVALATVGDVDQAGDWLRFALPTAVGLFSPWAGDDGGWMQGETYWKRSAPFTFQLFDALRTAAGIDLYKLPWTQNTIKYKTYMHPPYSTRGGFGDGPSLPPDGEDKLAATRLAAALQDPLAAWYAAAIPSVPGPITAFDILWYDPNVQPQAPEALPPSAAFLDSGLFAMHSSLTDPRGFHLYGRGSRFGSFNHAHADQGHFSLYAFGEPLLIDAGYYDWYRSPHATSFARTSLAHNVLLVNGKIGQRVGDITARGKIETFLHTELIDYAVVEASAAYPETALSSYRRHFIYLRPDQLIVWDEVKSPEKATFAWLLHFLSEPTVDEGASTAVVKQGAAGLVIGAFGPEKLQWSTSNRFPKNPTFAEEDVKASPQWHTMLRSTKKVEAEELVLLLLPFQGATAPALQALEVEGGRGMQAMNGQLIALLRQGEATPVAGGGLTAEANCVVLRRDGDGSETLFAHSLKSLSRGTESLLTVTVPVLIAGKFGPQLSVTVELTERGTISLTRPVAPSKVIVDGQEQVTSWAEEHLNIELAPGRHTLSVE
ncbi:MAG: DUF4962 domain-containing protein [Candidatus Zipacnadales bacterium]